MTAATAFVGMSHLGIVSSAAWASFGEAVIGFDPSAGLVEQLSAGNLPVAEPGLSELLGQVRPHLEFSADLARVAECQVVIVAQDVPTAADNTSDLGPIVDLVDRLIPHLAEGSSLVVMSQVAPGFTRQIAERVRRARPSLACSVLYLVETLIFGRAVDRALHPERFMVGAAEPTGSLPASFAARLHRFGCPVLVMRYESAELTKTAINLYLIGSVTLTNTLSEVCEAIGADWSEVVPALRLDARIGQHAYLRPGLGIAGGNLERDLATVRRLADGRDVDPTLLDALATYNERRFDWIERRLQRYVFDVEPRPRLAVWGLTYKKDTHSTKNSPAVQLIAALAERAEIRAWDPLVTQADLPADLSVAVRSTAADARDGADGLAIMTDWDVFGAADLAQLRQRMRRPVVVDCVGVLVARRSEMAGITYVAMGS